MGVDITLPTLGVTIPEFHVNAAQLCRTPRKQSITIKTVDCLIAQTAREQGVSMKSFFHFTV